MKKNGFFGIGCLNMKIYDNYGTLFRTAQIMGADFVFLIGTRFKKQVTDTKKSFRHIPVFEYENFEDFYKHKPYGCPIIGIELVENATPITEFTHPRQACYLPGVEVNELINEAIEACKDIIVLPGEQCLNVSVAGSIVLYDRVVKRGFAKRNQLQSTD